MSLTIFDELPAGCEAATVRNVYDGDTLTLIDERRVRLLGIDTPERKEQEPFAEEAKQYTRDLCDDKEIFLQFGQEREDHYGRLLAVIFVANPAGEGYLCVNQGIVHAGLAGYYCPGHTELPDTIDDELLEMQRDARENGRGKWHDFQDATVFTTARGRCFHARSCDSLARYRRPRQLKASEAMDRGLSACRNCGELLRAMLDQPDAPEEETAAAPVDAVAVYAELPEGCEAATVRNVYDGDTLTLTDERRVRLLGIDTPERKEQEPFAEEAKQYTRDLCDDKEIFLQFGQEREDHYGRLLAVIFVANPAGEGYLCVNQGIVHAGLAGYYCPGHTELPDTIDDELLEMQRDARENGRGKWHDFQDATVFTTARGRCFHARSCDSLARYRRPRQLKASEALDRGLSACRGCKGGE